MRDDDDYQFASFLTAKLNFFSCSKILLNSLCKYDNMMTSDNASRQKLPTLNNVKGFASDDRSIRVQLL